MSSMFSKARKHVSRVGLQPVKVIFSAEVRKVKLPSSVVLPENAKISVCFERGGKLAASKDKSFTRRGGMKIVDVDETLTLVATLFRDSRGIYQEKKGKLVVRQLQVGLLKVSSYKGIGVVSLDLHLLASEALTPTSRTVNLTQCADGATVDLTFTAKFIGEAEEGDETMSMLSDVSDGTVAAAEFAGGSAPSLSSLAVSTFETGAAGAGAGSSDFTSEGFISFGHNITEERTEDSNSIRESPTKADCVDEKNPPLIASMQSLAFYDSTAEPAIMKDQFTTDQRADSSSVNPAATQQRPRNTRLFLRPRAVKDERAEVPDAESESEIEAPVRSVSSSSRTMFVVYQERIQELQAALLAQAQASRTEEGELRRRHQASIDRYREEIDSLKADLERAREALKAHRNSSTLTGGFASLVSSSVAARSNTANEREGGAEYRALEGELESCKKAMKRAQDEAIQAQQDRDRYLEALESSMTITEREAALRAKKELELEALLNELIETKVASADYASELDEERSKVLSTQRKLQQYAQRVAKLEVQVAKGHPTYSKVRDDETA